MAQKVSIELDWVNRAATFGSKTHTQIGRFVMRIVSRIHSVKNKGIISTIIGYTHPCGKVSSLPSNATLGFGLISPEFKSA